MTRNAKRAIGNVMLTSAIVAAALGGAFAAAPREAFADDVCGTKEKPCPLQQWMRANMTPALAAGDGPALAAALDKAATLSPDASWNGTDATKSWDAIAKAGAAAARANDLRGAKAACQSCHEAFKEPYKSKFRTKPVRASGA